MSKSIANNAWSEYFKAVAFYEPHDGNESHSEANKSICGDLSECPPSEETAIVTAEDISQIKLDIARVKEEISALVLEVER
ncbi:CSC1-like protein At3g21620 [Aspergillus udagawae]|nr:CSC1-like protein At3g21620 [Aspergillus udagawae]